MKKLFLFCAFAVIFYGGALGQDAAQNAAQLPAQNAAQLPAQNAAQLPAQSSYIIPRQIFVGDLAVLILPLPAAPENSSDIILTGDSLPESEDIDINRIILERRAMGSRLMIEFTAFAPGILELPVIEIAGEYFEGLSVTVNSILDGRSDRILSAAASTLAIPGTALMLYGSLAAIAGFLLFIIWFALKGRKVFSHLKQKWKLHRLFAGLRKIEKRLNREILNGTDFRIILDNLSEETREFLSVLTGENCRAMTAREFENLPRKSLFMQEGSPAFLSIFFKRCDQLRFSGSNVTSHNILHLLGFLRNFIDTLVNAKKDGLGEEKAA